jgi:hypothetical protein
MLQASSVAAQSTDQPAIVDEHSSAPHTPSVEDELAAVLTDFSFNASSSGRTPEIVKMESVLCQSTIVRDGRPDLWRLGKLGQLLERDGTSNTSPIGVTINWQL